jgi:hypothetical protein
VTGRQWKGTAFGGFKSRDDLPKLVNKVVTGELNIDEFVTHKFTLLADVNKAVDALHEGSCLRSIIQINEAPIIPKEMLYNVKVEASSKYFGGTLKTVSHWSRVNNCQMKFMIFIPHYSIKEQRREPYPVLYFLSGLTCTYENAPTKSNFAAYA